LAANTWVIVTADHGDEFFEHGQKGHRKNLFDDVILVPLIVQGPGVQRRSSGIQEQISLIDIAPTILSAFDAPRPAEMMGEDLTGMITGKSTKLPSHSTSD